MNENFTTSSEPFSVRRFEMRDREAVLALWPATVVTQAQPDLQTIQLMIDSVEGAIAGKDHLWVAEARGRIIGSVAVIRDTASLAHLRCLCVASDIVDRHAVARGLARTAITDAWDRGYLKLVVHTDFPSSRLTTVILHNLGFEFSRESSLGGEHVLEFYQNFYELPRQSLTQDGQQEIPNENPK
jgi:N-acetylglutamate synthase-like GNAT family acetyltransferase